MNRAILVLFALSLVLPAAAGDKIGGAISDAVGKKVQEREAAKENAPEKDLPVSANVGNKSPSRWHSVLWGDQDDSLNVASCPMGMAGAPSFEEVRTHFRALTDNEMWKICVNRSTYQGAVSGACACSLLAYPSPWRDVETPHTAERPDEPVAEPEPDVSEK